MAAPAKAQADLEKGQALFDFLLPAKATLRPEELAAILSVSERSIQRAFDCEELMGLGLNFTVGVKDGLISTRRIPRQCALIWLARHANYTPEDLEDRIAEILATQNSETLLRLQARLQAALARSVNR